MTQTITDLGRYVQHEGRPAVRFVRTYPHPVERVWRAVTDPAELPRWFPSTVQYEARVGAAVRFADDPYKQDSDDDVVLAWDPPHRFAFGWGGDEVHLELEEVPGGCRLTLVNVLAAENTASRNASGWYVCLDELRKVLADLPSAGPHSSDAIDWTPVLAAHEAAGLPTGAEIPDSTSQRS